MKNILQLKYKSNNYKYIYINILLINNFLKLLNVRIMFKVIKYYIYIIYTTI